MKPRALLAQLNAGRIAIGAGLIARPEAVTSGWDATDLLATHAARHRLPRAAAPLIYVLAGGALVAGAANLGSGDDSGPIT